MSHEIPMISLVKRGSKSFPRFVVAKSDEFRNPHFWTGSAWTSDESEAALFSDVTQALWVYHDLLMECVSDRPCHRYVAPLYIEVYGEKPTLAVLRDWLERAVRIVVDSPKHGLGPSDTVGVIILDAEMTESV